MKMKKLFIATAFTVLSASALWSFGMGPSASNSSSDNVTVEVGYYQGFPLEYMKMTKDDKFEEWYYNPSYEGKLFRSSSGFELTGYFNKFVGLSLNLDFGYGSSMQFADVKEPTAGYVSPIKYSNIKKSFSSMYLRLGPAFKIGNKHIGLLLTPGIVMGNLKESYKWVQSNTYIEPKYELSYFYAFGLGSGAAVQIGIGDMFVLNLGADFNYLMWNSSIERTSNSDKPKKYDGKDGAFMSIIPKIGIAMRI